MKSIRFCENCRKSKNNTSIPVMFFSKNHNEDVIKDFFAGYIYGIQEKYWDDTDKCPFCQSKTIDLNINEDDIYSLFITSTGNRQLLDAMIKLHDEDIIEYELKMSQFRTQVEQQESAKKQIQQQQENNIPHCPICNSTNIKKISSTERVTSVAMLGIFSKKINKSFKCKNCGGTF